MIIRCAEERGSKRRAARAWIALLLLGLAACQSVQPEPFSDFNDALVKLRTGVDAALDVNAVWATERFVTSVVAAQRRIDQALAAGEDPEPEDLDLIQGLLLETVAGDALTPLIPDDQLYLRARRFRQGVYQLNSVFTQYAELLVQLAAPLLVPREQFEKMAKDLNANAGAALEALGVGGISDAARGVFSIAVAEGARLGIEAQRRSKLEETLTKNQGTVQAYADKGREAIVIGARHSQQEYEERSAALVDDFVDASASARPILAEQIAELNAQYVERLAVLESLDVAYARIPRAHSQLLKATGGPGVSYDSLVALLEDASRLLELAKEIQ